MSAHALPDGPVFRKVFDANPDGMLLVDARGRIVLANGAAADLLGYSQAALEGMPVDALVPDAVAPRHAAYRQAYAHGPKVRPMGTDLELMAKRADGSAVMVEIALSPLREGSGEGAVDYVVAAIRGIGAYPRVQRAMRRARYNEFLVQLGRIAVDTLDPDELMQRTPDAVREALEAEAVTVLLLSASQRELRTVSYSGMRPEAALWTVYPNEPDIAPGFVVAQRAPVVVADMANERRFALPPHLVDAGVHSGVAVPLIDRGKVIGVLGAWSRRVDRFGDDEVAFLESAASLLSTSQQRAQAEAHARHAQRLETVGQLTGGVAHDFNNLLTVIQGYLQMLGDQPAVRDDALSREMLTVLQRTGQRGADLTGKLLAFARRQALEPSPVDPIALLQSLADMLGRTLGENIRVVVQAPDACPRVLIDPVQLESALLNVAVNARDAMPGGGTLMLRCGTGAPPAPGPADAAVPPDAGEEVAAREWVWVSLQDNGSGMTQDVRDRAFEPFFTTKEAGRGTGLGLSTVYGFIKQSQGLIELDSAVGAGTTVTLYLPAMNGNDEASAAAAIAGQDPPRGLRVLLVEDDPDVRRVAEAFLRSMHCDVVACPSAEAALAELAAGATFSLLFSDVMLGAGMHGHELAQRVAARYPELPVLLTTGYSRSQDRHDASPTMLHVPTLRKPYTREALAHAIAQCLPGRTR